MQSVLRRQSIGFTLAAAAAVLAGTAMAVAAQGAERERFTPVATQGEIAARIAPRSLDATPVLVVAFLAGESVADVQLRTGRELSRTEKNAVKAQRRAEQAAPRVAIEAAGGRVVGSFQSALNGIKVRIPQNRISELRKIRGVVEVKRVNIFTRENFLGVQRVQAPFSWSGSRGVHGENIKVAIIDTGIDYTHATFGGPGTPEAYEAAFATSTAPADPSQFGPAAPKVKGGIDLVGDAYDANDPASVPAPDPNPLDCNGHGTHVAGTAAGFGVLGDGTTFTGPYDHTTHDNVFKVGPGVAPRADLYAIRVFGCEGSTSLVPEALEWAVDNDMDVVNMSLGSSFGTADDASAAATNSAVIAGISVVTSAGNAGPIDYVTGSPGTASRAIATASTPSIGSLHTVNFDTNPVVNGINANGAEWSSPQTLPLYVLRNAAGGVSLGCKPPLGPDDYVGKDVVGKMVVVLRGSCARVAKAIFAEQAGAAAVVMINNANVLPPFEGPITSNPDDGTPYTVTIPFFGVRGSTSNDDDLLVARDGTPVTISEGAQIPTGTSSFSSIGPRTGDSFLKPDISAPGEAIVSAGVGTGNGPATLSGTSMASPHVAGVAALTRQAHPTWGPGAIKSAIINSGEPGAIAGYLTRRNGGGLVNAASATGTSAYAFGESQRTSVSFGLAEFSSSLQRTKPIIVRNTASTAVTFDTAVAMQGSPHTATLGAAQITVPPKGQSTVNLTLTVSAATAGNSDAFRDVGGVVTFTPTSPTANNGIALTVPYYLVPRVSANVTGSLPRFRGFPQASTATVRNANSAIAAQTDFYAWGLQSPSIGLGKADLRAAGVQAIDVGAGEPLVVFAVNTHKAWSSGFTVEFDIFVDADGDAEDDFVIFNVDLGLLTTGVRNGQHVAAVLDLHTNGLVVDAFVFAPTDSSTMLLPVFASSIGLTSGNPRFSYNVVAFDLQSDAEDTFATGAKFNAFTPAISTGAYEMVEPNTTVTVPIAVNPAEFGVTPALGVMIVAQDNKNGAQEARLLPAKF